MIDMDEFNDALDQVLDGAGARHRVRSLHRAALARAVAAEALAADRLEDALFAEQRATDAELARAETETEIERLQAELAALRAATRWRPVTETPPHGRVLGWDRVYGPTTTTRRAMVRKGSRFTHWQPLPPPPGEEPTP